MISQLFDDSILFIPSFPHPTSVSPQFHVHASFRRPIVMHRPAMLMVLNVRQDIEDCTDVSHAVIARG